MPAPRSAAILPTKSSGEKSVPSIRQGDTPTPGLTRRFPLESAPYMHKNLLSQNKLLWEGKCFPYTLHPALAPPWRFWQPPPSYFPQSFSGHFPLKHWSCFPHSACQKTAFSHYSGSEAPLHIPAWLPGSICGKARSGFPGKLHRNFHYLKTSHSCCGKSPLKNHKTGNCHQNQNPACDQCRKYCHLPVQLFKHLYSPYCAAAGTFSPAAAPLLLITIKFTLQDTDSPAESLHLQPHPVRFPRSDSARQPH